VNTKDLITREALVASPYYDPLPIVLCKGKGPWLWDLEGKKYLDMTAAYATMSFGHCNERLLQALAQQAQKLTLTSRAFHTDQLAPLLEKACAMSGFNMGAPMNTGAEIVETAIKVARRWGYEVKGIPKDRAEIIVAENNFHGRTTTTIGFSTEPLYQKDFGPFTPGFSVIPFGNADALEKAITPNTCAFLVEPIQGEIGVIVPPEGWLTDVRQICTKNNVLLILDEVQSGLGRTGKMFACQHEEVQPDVVLLGKGLGGGIVPISLMLSRRDILSLMTPGSHGSTFGGNPLACAVAYEALCILEEDRLDLRAAELGAYMLKRLKALDSPLIKAVRGKGLWAGVDFHNSLVSAREVCEKMLLKGVLVKETHGITIRFAPPLIITQEELKFGLDAFEDVLKEIAQEKKVNS
jgi:ornithine--oxo-acid transaminase